MTDRFLFFFFYYDANVTCSEISPFCSNGNCPIRPPFVHRDVYEVALPCKRFPRNFNLRDHCRGNLRATSTTNLETNIHTYIYIYRVENSESISLRDRERNRLIRERESEISRVRRPGGLYT